MSGHEKRREARRIATGEVRVKLVDPEPLEIEGKLIDVSANGFRMSHDCAALRSGQVVDFAYVAAKGRAQAMWTRILTSGVETGFLIVA
ncbi:MAG: hypothetical protein ABSF22_05130 [Bryobacteraceae bacterium]|jgi:hypothetical protein